MKLPKNKKKIIILSSLAVIVLAGAIGGFVAREKILASMGTQTTSRSAPIVTEYEPKKTELTEINDRKKSKGAKQEGETLGARSQSSAQGGSSTSSTRTSDSKLQQESTYVKPIPRSTTCNEALKRTYTTDYNTKVAAENTRWKAVIAAIQADAASKGLTSGNYIDSQTKKQLPYHTATLANLKSSYQAKMTAINCAK